MPIYRRALPEFVVVIRPVLLASLPVLPTVTCPASGVPVGGSRMKARPLALNRAPTESRPTRRAFAGSVALSRAPVDELPLPLRFVE
jgi:hypothetical protein